MDKRKNRNKYISEEELEKKSPEEILKSLLKYKYQYRDFIKVIAENYDLKKTLKTLTKAQLINQIIDLKKMQILKKHEAERDQIKSSDLISDAFLKTANYLIRESMNHSFTKEQQRFIKVLINGLMKTNNYLMRRSYKLRHL